MVDDDDGGGYYYCVIIFVNKKFFLVFQLYSMSYLGIETVLTWSN